ncbi:MAG: MarR family transcriptional regulator [Leptospiraceae bacterium]|nr:MarR family transcriptional regulator [Leptospiraceae bacterium]
MKDRGKVSDLETHLGYWLRFVSNQVSHSFAQKVKEKGVTVAEWVFLRQLYEGEERPGRLAEALGMTKGAISKLADRLQQKKLIVRKEESDGRAHTLRLSPSGRRLVPVLAALADENDAAFFGHLKSRDRKLIQDVMKDIVTRQGLKSVPVE